VIPEESETSVEIFSRVLKRYLIPKGTIEQFIRDIRSDTYKVLRSPSDPTADLSTLTLNIPNVDITALTVFPESSGAGESLSAISVREDYGISILAIRRNGEVLVNPSGDMDLEPDDEVIVIGAPDAILRLSRLFHPEERSE
jgi:CPA2 family monovalent cation:H+ antiporter-2